MKIEKVSEIFSKPKIKTATVSTATKLPIYRKVILTSQNCKAYPPIVFFCNYSVDWSFDGRQPLASGFYSYGDSRLGSISRRQSVSKPIRNTNCPIESDSLLPIGNATVGENPSVKGRLPDEYFLIIHSTE
ncbi:MAG: hypothetical protein LBG58_00180 [Planctomycetaceae bacterium]|nr:hypothetical protein [Planctomycetaceae bacterium]